MNEPRSSIQQPFDPQSLMDVGDEVSTRMANQQEALQSAHTLDDVLEAFRTFSGSEHEKGDRFERLIKRILEVDPEFSAQFTKVWRWNDWPGRKTQDIGVDLVAEREDGGICAIQCKFFAPTSQVSLPHVTNFLATADHIRSDQRIFVSTTAKIASNARKLLENPNKPTTLLGLDALRGRDVDWPDIASPESLDIRTEKFDLFPDQQKALDDVVSGFAKHDRGQLILPCGVGKTFTSLRIAEEMVGNGGTVLFLVPSIALLAQAMRQWAEQANLTHRYIGVCSDVKAGRNSEDASISELVIPVTTDMTEIANELSSPAPNAMKVVFSTYQSIERIRDAQNTPVMRDDGSNGLAPEFDLVICDEAHRTTGVETGKGDGSYYTLVHNGIKARKRLYMTATPRIYSEAAKNKALKIGQVALYSMDDESQYGPEFHRMTFHEAVENHRLTDYKVVILNINEARVTAPLQRVIADGGDGEINLDDAAKIIGCSSALIAPEGPDNNVAPLQRAIAFANTIKNSKQITDSWSSIINESRELLTEEQLSRMHSFELDHVDGKMNALERNKRLDWLRQSEEEAPNACRVLSNARCLSEGVDVPALNAVLFLQPRRSIVDVVQAVGRVMRTAPGKKFGYIILPVIISAGVDPAEALDDNESYRVVWEVLQALRSHDERLDAEINQLDLNKAANGHIQIIGVGGDGDASSEKVIEELPIAMQYELPGLVIEAFHAKVVEKCGDRQYWDRWAKDVASIATTLEHRIRELIPQTGNANGAPIASVGLKFESLLQAMRAATNDELTEDGAIAIVAQHMITEPVFQTLFKDHDFAKSNPVAASLNQFVELINQHGLAAELDRLQPFYESVKRRAAGLDNSDARRKVLEELYENFFKNALPKEAQRLGVVYTPHEIVDYILRSVDYLLRKEFGKSLSDEGVHILDPFAGMGTFIWRLLSNSDLIRDKDLERKFWEELHANEILPLAYYMASVNVEEAFRERFEARDGEDPGYLAFEGMVWRDTFNAMTRGTDQQASMWFMQDNDKRARHQDETDIGVIVSNPPYSAWQRSADDDNANVFYPLMRGRIEQTYAVRSRAKLRTSLNDHYKMAIRWATDRLPKSGGILGFVTNASFLDGNADSGLRACLAEEFTSIYAFDLRGNARTSGEQRRKEKDNVFGQGTRTPIAITLFVKNPKAQHQGCRIYYRDIGDYLTQQQKLVKVADSASVDGYEDWQLIEPDQDFDWIKQSDRSFEVHAPLGKPHIRLIESVNQIFLQYANGLKTHRDVWLYDFDRTSLINRIFRMTDFYNELVSQLKHSSSENDDILRPQSRRIKWTPDLKEVAIRGELIKFDESRVCESLYRPMTKLYFYYEPLYIAALTRIRHFYPTSSLLNQSIVVQGTGGAKEFSSYITEHPPNLHSVEAGQTFPKHTYDSSDGTEFARYGTRPDQTRPDQTRPDQTRPDQTRPDQTRPDQTRPDQTRPDQTRPDQTRPDQTRPDQTRPDQTRPDQTRPDLARTRESRNCCRRCRSNQALQRIHHRHCPRSRTRHQGTGLPSLPLRRGQQWSSVAVAMLCLAALKWIWMASFIYVTTIYLTRHWTSIRNITPTLR